MDINNIIRDKRKSPGEKATVMLSIRITPEISKWLKEKNYSPTGIFKEALRELKCPNLK
jgi:hypothetical protein